MLKNYRLGDQGVPRTGGWRWGCQSILQLYLAARSPCKSAFKSRGDSSALNQNLIGRLHMVYLGPACGVMCIKTPVRALSPATGQGATRTSAIPLHPPAPHQRIIPVYDMHYT